MPINTPSYSITGTLQLAVVAKHFGVPFFVAAPTTTIDHGLSSGDDIVIEQRSAREMTHIGETRIAAEGVSCWNPSFDVTPAALIRGIITEKGVAAHSSSSTDVFDLTSFQ